MALKNKVVFSYGLLCFMLFNLSTAQAQSPENGEAAEGQTEIKPLQIGDTIPEELWNLPLQVINHPEGKDTISLNDYRDKKLIILDFWATWCGGCIRALKEGHAVRDSFAYHESLLLPVTYQSEEEIQRTVEMHSLDFMQVVEDRTVSDYFIHQALPHTVVIRDNIFHGILSHESLDKQGFLDLLKGGRVKWTYTNKLLNKRKLLFSEGNGEGKMFYSKSGLTLLVANEAYLYEPIQELRTENTHAWYGNGMSLRSLIYLVYKDEVDPNIRGFLKTAMVYSTPSVREVIDRESEIKLGMLYEPAGLAYSTLKTEFSKMLTEVYGIQVKIEMHESRGYGGGAKRKIVLYEAKGGRGGNY